MIMTRAPSLALLKGRSKLVMRVNIALHLSVYEKHHIKDEISRVAPKCHIEMLLLTDHSKFSFPAKVIKCQNITEKEILLLLK